MKNNFKKITAFFLTVTMLFAICCVSAFAVDVDYAHFEIGTFETTEELKPGDTVRIPVSIVGMKEGQYCGGFGVNITLGAGLEWFDTNAECTEFTELLSSFGAKFVNHSNGLFTGMDFGASSTGKTSCSHDGKICDLLCRVTEDYDGANATIALSGVSISGTTSLVFLNSTDGTSANVDSGAIIFDGEKVAEGTVLSVVNVAEPKEYSIVAEANPTEVVAGDDVTVTVTVKGGEYVGAAVKLSYDIDKLELKTAANGWDATSNGYAYYNVNNTGDTFAEDTVIGTFVFTAKALSAETETVVSLDASYVAESFDDGWNEEPANEVANTDATITIKLDKIDVTVPTMAAITYDGEYYAFEPVTVTPADATITYSETENGEYSATIPEKKDAGEYTLYYKVEKLGFEPVSGSYTMTINKRPITVAADDKEKVYGEADPALTYTVDNVVEGESIEVTTYRESGEDVGEYVISVTQEEGKNPNYDITFADGKFIITGAAIEGYVITAKNNVSYDGNEHVSATVTEGTPDDATITYKWTDKDGVEQTSYDKVPSFTDVGTYTVSYTISKVNYTDVTGNYTFTINNGEITGYIITNSEPVNYDEQPHVSATVTEGTPDDVTITYKWTENGEEKTSTTAPSFTNVGEYTVNYTISKDNYTDVTGSYTFTINSGIVEASAENVNEEYDGQPHSITVTVTQPEGSTISYRTSEEAEWSEDNPEFTNVTETPATVYWKVSKDGYADKTGSASVTITKKNVTISVNDKVIALGENLPAFDGTVTGLVNEGDLGKITYTCDGFKQEIGDYDITASYTDNDNYNVTVDNGTLTVTAPEYVVEIVDEYVVGYHMILVYTNSAATFSYDGNAMYDVTDSGYKYNNTETTYAHVYALVVEGNEGDIIESLTAKVSADMTSVAGTLIYGNDVNSSGTVDLNDAVAIVAVYNAKETYMTQHMPIVLKADVNGDKVVNASDFGVIKAEYLK